MLLWFLNAFIQDMVHDKDIAILVVTPCSPGRLEARVLCHLFQAEDAVDCLDHLGFTLLDFLTRLTFTGPPVL
jgi:hypothetical protein